MSEDLNQNGSEENGDIPEIELIIKVRIIWDRDIILLPFITSGRFCCK